MANPRWRLRAGGYATAIWAFKITFFFLGVLFVGAAARAAVPAAAGALASSLPGPRAAFLSWIRPPFLFIAVHFIILVIWKLSDQKQQREQWSAEEFGDPEMVKSFDNSRSSNINRKPSTDIWSDEISQSPSPDLTESSQSDASCLTVDSVERSTASSVSSIKKSAEPESDRGATVEEEEDLAAALAIAGVENDSMEATWKAIMDKPSRTAAPPSEAASPAPSRRDYRPLDPPPPPVGHDELTQRFDEFIKKNHQQIRFHTSRRR
ncbi:uncharacterized protein LOC122034833 [Zingiber officinale]|uniref:uncharacterized protein LOC122034833 n=1 Tax=Zingiber officinale TaxID=94328 RepID=UPI001C4AC078|nr:uncharacterized protein LOC122034833 [Zingiber officinale]XP_042450123.1 uncharacterized protein LOC122034833 [Zingiber officinale]